MTTSKQLPDLVLAGVDQRERPPCGPGSLRFEVEAEAVDRSWPRRRAARPAARPARRRSGRCVPTTRPPLHAAAGEVDRPALRPVVAPAGRIDPRRAAELRQVAHQRVVEHARAATGPRAARCRPGRTSGQTMSCIPSIDVNGFEPWMSQVISSKTVRNVLTVTNRTPASISRRASRQHWPKRVMP